MSANVIQLVRSTMTDSVVRQLSESLGQTQQATQAVFTVTLPALVTALMNKSATLDGARSLFTTLLGPQVNAQISEQLPQLIATTAGLNQLEQTGRHLLERVLDRRVDHLSDVVALQTGAATQPAHGLAGVLGATLLGVLKRHFLDTRSDVSALPALLSEQLPHVIGQINDPVSAALGMGTVMEFAEGISGQLKTVASELEPTVERATPPGLATFETAAGVGVGGVRAVQPARTQAPLDALIREQKRSRTGLWWFLAAALVVAFLCIRGCHNGKGDGSSDGTSEAVASVPPEASGVAAIAASAVPASATLSPQSDTYLSFRVSPLGEPTLTARLSSEGERSALIEMLEKKLGRRFSADLSVDPAIKPATWLTHFDALLPLMTQSGAELKLEGHEIELSGTALQPGSNWVTQLQSQFGNDYRVGGFNEDQAVAQATTQFQQQIKALLNADGSCASADFAKTLNLQVINFSTGTARIPVSAINDLNETAKALKRCQADGKTVQLEVSGYSDNVGVPAANLQLSKKRAASVREFLVQAGVPAESLRTKGYGQLHPVASNDTESGRFANRRIEFIEIE
ncbi:OmpA family protein [Paraburkholderia bonniea]|uniref:OmpA family protein n=1 Tax=Paraburkholderia bonniea TaxID=2152891 RepID=UPI001291D72F|nr:OmpA family protein [Paraburkholderia bonniea]